ncbi:hypothetical protein POTOM_061915 [Populus tomentosa]|uniref:Translation initiation factor 5A-like N-terminal domain-containing protein n=1 Tax=Populus tomentosa TaxID=118781 RepID=A0A8X7XNK9_POPTO|nr:hypothetical protein POTOM_061915 [Populus tomentosa]
MSDEEHHFESKADAGASKTYPQQAGTIRKNGYIVIKNRPCKISDWELSYLKLRNLLRVKISDSGNYLVKSLESFELSQGAHVCDALKSPLLFCDFSTRDSSQCNNQKKIHEFSQRWQEVIFLHLAMPSSEFDRVHPFECLFCVYVHNRLAGIIETFS